ncbi:hypothetical protein BJ165DRAFT_109845 [Panaeolus papilionaceus]|nr:hypothetical protein BJ165DRAFT_109845 [Panaeolus papilionaceus]
MSHNKRDSHAAIYATTALKDPMNPTRCGGVLDFALSSIDESNYEEFSDKFWKTLHRFLLSKRTDAQLKVVLDRLAQCSCPDDEFGLHSSFASSKAEPRRTRDGLLNNSEARSFIMAAFQLLNWVLGPNVLSVVEVKRGIRKRWPRRIPDLLPEGPDQLIENFVQWERMVPWSTMSVVERSLLQFIHICGSLLWDSLIKFDATNKLFINVTRIYMYSLIHLLEEGRTSTLNSPEIFAIIISDFVTYLRRICTHPTKSPLLMGGGETKALQLCSIALYLLPSFSFTTQEDADRFEMIADAVAQFGRFLFLNFRMPLKLHPRIVIKVTSSPRLLDMPPPPEMITVAMLIGRMEHPCAAKSCQIPFTHVPNEFKLCSRCMSVGYCGRLCQVNDCKDEEFPHKRICPLLCKIIEARGGWKAPIPETILRKRNPPVEGFIKPHDLLLHVIPELVARMRMEGTIPEDDYIFLTKWAERIYSTKVMERDSETEAVLHPGFEDYDDILKKIMTLPILKAPEPRFVVI